MTLLRDVKRGTITILLPGALMKKIGIVGTLDTKFEKMGFIRDFVQKKGHDPVVIDAGIRGNGAGVPEIPWESGP
jgi:uncharacterized protein (UPF0261 family)